MDALPLFGFGEILIVKLRSHCSPDSFVAICVFILVSCVHSWTGMDKASPAIKRCGECCILGLKEQNHI